MIEHHIVVPRTARYQTLGAPDASVRDVWIVCHGFGQLAADFVKEFETIALPERLIVAPEALNRFYVDSLETRRGTPGRVGATWMTREDRTFEIDDYVGYLDRLAEHVLAPLSGDVRVRALGFSQGVATVSRWAVRSRIRIDEVILWAGAIPGDVDLGANLERARRMRFTLVLGARDQYATWAGAEQEHARLQSLGLDSTLIGFDGGHRMDRGVLTELASTPAP